MALLLLVGSLAFSRGDLSQEKSVLMLALTTQGPLGGLLSVEAILQSWRRGGRESSLISSMSLNLGPSDQVSAKAITLH